MSGNLKTWYRYSLVAALLVLNIGCDQVSKKMVRQTLQHAEQVTVLPGHITLTRVENTGAFLSLGHALPALARTVLLLVLPALALLGGLVYVCRNRQLSMWMVVGITAVVGGGIGNLYDRWCYGSVTDFMHVNLVWFQTGIFNVADVSIMIGVAMMLLDNFRGRRTSSETR